MQGATEICGTCLQDLPVINAACPQCGLPLEVNDVCGRCLVTPPPFHRCVGLFHYTYPLDTLIKAFKFKGQLALGFHLGALMAKLLTGRVLDRPECLIPVPLHWARLMSRGYNQSLELARPISRILELPLDYRCCKRTRFTAPQANLAAHLRQRNIKGAFVVKQDIPYQHVALVDDVVTTGSTVIELTRQLFSAGVKRVDVWALARA
jgi:ComF family protein